MQECGACSDGSTFDLWFNTDDSDPSHLVYTSYGTSNLVLYRNGAQVDAVASNGDELTGLSGGPATYRAVYDTDATGVDGITQATKTHTDLTFVYTPQPGDPATTLPAADLCFAGVEATSCQILPALTLDYRLATDETNTSHAPIQTMNLDVAHLTYDGKGSHAPITSARVSVSFDGGTSWVPALVLGVNGHYTASWPNPASAAGSSPMLKVTATDAAGGSITQTITNAYTIAARN